MTKRTRAKQVKDEAPNESQGIAGGLRTFYPKVSDEVATESFRRALDAPKEGENCIVPKFEQIMNFCCQNLEAFTITDVLNYSKAFSLDFPEVKRLFEIWKETNLRLNRIVVTLGCYSDEIITPV
jgi:hypothetical protein